MIEAARAFSLVTVAYLLLVYIWRDLRTVRYMRTQRHGLVMISRISDRALTVLSGLLILCMSEVVVIVGIGIFGWPEARNILAALVIQTLVLIGESSIFTSRYTASIRQEARAHGQRIP